VQTASFEEKEFENPVNHQLVHGDLMWTPGQMLEKVIGFDAAIFVETSSFWSALGLSKKRAGTPILASWWKSRAAQSRLSQKPPPSFPINAFLQYKRPEYLTSSKTKEWRYWKQPFFRFQITPHQHAALLACASQVGSRGIVAYGSPAFHLRDDLFYYTKNRLLVRNTHFVAAERLSGHKKYTYIDAVTKGKAHSDPKEVVPLRLDLADNSSPPPRVPSDGADGSAEPPGITVFAIARRCAEQAVYASPNIVGSVARYMEAVASALRVLNEDEQPVSEVVENFVFAQVFSVMSGIAWLMRQAD